jgi:hypothetical protein
MRRRLFLLFAALSALALIVAGTLFYLVRTDEVWESRVIAAPYMLRGYLRQLQPEVELPTPSSVSNEDRDRLLAGIATVAPSAVAPQSTATSALPRTLTPPATHAAPSATPQDTPTLAPTATPSQTPFPLTPVASEIRLNGVNHAAQMWNNCGPTTIVMNLSFFGLDQHQRESAAYLKPNPDDKNVSPWQLAAYAESQGFATIIRVGGTPELLQELISNDFPVIVEDWILPEDRGGMGHYRLLTGYDAAERYFIAQDSYFGPDKQVPFDDFNRSWHVFNRKYLVVYEPQRQDALYAILGPMVDDQQMLARALVEAQSAVQTNPADPLAWYTLGATYTELGRMQDAVTAFDEARRIGLPLRTLWYQFELFDAYLAVGRYQEVIDLGYATAYTAAGHEEAYYYQGLGYLQKGEPETAAAHFRKALDYNHNFEPAQVALAELDT